MNKISLQEQIDLIKVYVDSGPDQHRKGFQAVLKNLLKLLKKEIKTADQVKKIESYKQFVDRYFEFYKDQNLGTPKMNPAAGLALKEIIQYLMSLPKSNGSEQMAYNGWDFILKNWKALPVYLQDKTALLSINKHKEAIIYNFNNVTKTGKKQLESDKKQQLKSALKNR